MKQNNIEQENGEGLVKSKRAKVINAFLIGFCIGIIVFSVAKNTLGLLTLIPIFFIYKLVNGENKE